MSDLVQMAKSIIEREIPTISEKRRVGDPVSLVADPTSLMAAGWKPAKICQQWSRQPGRGA